MPSLIDFPMKPIYARAVRRFNQDPWSGHLLVFTKRVTSCPYALFS